MTIKRIVILPPLAFARFGSHPEPVASYTLEPPPPDKPLGYRKIAPEPTLIVSENGEIVGVDPKPNIRFKEIIKKNDEDEIHQVRPVAPFFELWGELDDGRFVHLTEQELKKHGNAQVQWCVEVANRKVFRRTRSPDDIVLASTGWFADHNAQELHGKCRNFVEGGYVKLGTVRFIQPNQGYPEIRLRFTPGAGLIYGTDKQVVVNERPMDETFLERRIYNSSAGWWEWEHDKQNEENAESAEEREKKARERNDIETIPPSLYAIVPPAPPWLNEDKAVSRGYLDDACDGFVQARLVVDGKPLTIDGKDVTAKARIGVAPPHYAPNSLFVRNLIDDLEQAYAGKDITGNSRERALDIVRRAFETVRYMNVAVMNGNPFKGRDPLELDTMPAEEAFGTERPLRPVFAPDGADTRTIAALHQRAYTALSSGSAGWFTKLLRQPEQVGDLSDEGRRKMPALMCSAESLYLALTRRQISAIEHLDSADAPEPWPLYPIDAEKLKELRPRNRSAELMYKPLGNPLSSHPIVAISNCCPGLEFDFRAVWRRLLKGITLVEWDNLVVEADEGFGHLKGRRLLQIDDLPVLAEVTGPRPSDVKKPLPLICDDYPEGVVCMEWSNSFARILHRKDRRVTCIFSAEQWGRAEPGRRRRKDKKTWK